MKLEGYRRLEAHVPTELWDEIEKARGQMTRSEFTRQALRAQLDYPSMMAAPNGNDGAREKSEAKPVVGFPTGRVVKVVKTTPAVKTAREILQERTRLMRGNGS